VSKPKDQADSLSIRSPISQLKFCGHFGTNKGSSIRCLFRSSAQMNGLPPVTATVVPEV